MRINSQDLKNLIDYLMTNNSCKNLSAMENRKMPKYFDFQVLFTLDTKDGIVFTLLTRPNGKGISFLIEMKEDLEKLYNWLDKQDID